MQYRALWIVEIVMVVLTVVMLATPIRDYALRQFKNYVRHPSAETMKAFQEKKLEESRLRLKLAAPFAVIAVLLLFPLVSSARKRKSLPPR